MKLTHELPRADEIDTYYSLETIVDRYLELYEEEMLSDDELDYINEQIALDYKKAIELQEQLRKDINDTNDSLCGQ